MVYWEVAWEYGRCAGASCGKLAGMCQLLGLLLARAWLLCAGGACTACVHRQQGSAHTHAALGLRECGTASPAGIACSHARESA